MLCLILKFAKKKLKTKLIKVEKNIPIFTTRVNTNLLRKNWFKYWLTINFIPERLFLGTGLIQWLVRLLIMTQWWKSRLYLLGSFLFLLIFITHVSCKTIADLYLVFMLWVLSLYTKKYFFLINLYFLSLKLYLTGFNYFKTKFTKLITHFLH